MITFRVGVLGSGVISSQYLTNLNACDEVELVAIAGRSPASVAAQAEAFGIEARSFAGLLDDDSIELIVNLTPPTAHRETSLAIIAAGKHLWSEKPLAMTPFDAREIVAAAAERGVRVGVAPDTILGPAHRRALAAITDGRIGTPRSATATVQYWGPDAWHPNPEFLFREGAGPLRDMGGYWLALLVQVFGPVESVVAEGRTSRPLRTIEKGPRAGESFAPTVPSYVSALLNFAGGGTAVCIFSYEASTKEFSLVVSGDEGAIRFADPNGFVGDVTLIVRDEVQLVTGFNEVFSSGRGLGVFELMRSLRSGVPVVTDAVLGLHLVLVMEAIELSALRGVRVEVAGL